MSRLFGRLRRRLWHDGCKRRGPVWDEYRETSGTGEAVEGDGRHRAGIVGFSDDVNAAYFSTGGTYAALLGTDNKSSGLSAYNDNSTYAALYAEADNGAGSSLYVNNHVTGLGFFVDYTGSGFFSGKVDATGFYKTLRTRTGGPVKSYEASSTEETIEDTGSGSLVRARALHAAPHPEAAMVERPESVPPLAPRPRP